MARSKEFDENAVLDKAMKLFWEQGYEKTSLNDLVEHMGIHRRSLYDTFTDKRTLYMKAMERFGARMQARWESRIKQAETSEQALRSIFELVINGEEDAPAGCMFVNSAVELANADTVVDTLAVTSFARTEELLAEIVAEGQKNGEFASKDNPRELAEFLHNVLMGLRVQARTSAANEKKQRVAERSIRMLNG